MLGSLDYFYHQGNKTRCNINHLVRIQSPQKDGGKQNRGALKVIRCKGIVMNITWPVNETWIEERGIQFGTEIPIHWTKYAPVSNYVCYVWGGVLLIIGVIGLLGNGIVLFVFTRFRRLRGPFSCFILNLAFADFCTSVLHFMVVCSSFNRGWLFGRVGCKIYACCVGLFGLVSIVTLSTIAVERYLVITAKPFSGTWKITQYGARKVCLVVWFYCLAVVLPPLFGWSAYVPEGFLTSCSWDYLTRTPTNRAYYIYLLTLGFLIPVSVITYCYIFILAAIVAHSREMKSVKSTGGSMYGSLSGSLSRGVAYCMNSTNPTRATIVTWASSTIRTAEIILMLILLFLVAWVPYAVVTLVGQFGDQELITPWVSALPGLFAKASVIYNPIIYGLSHPHFRSSVRQYFSTCTTVGSHAGGTSLVSVHHRNPSRRMPSSPDHNRHSVRKQLSAGYRETTGLTVVMTPKGKTNTLLWTNPQTDRKFYNFDDSRPASTSDLPDGAHVNRYGPESSMAQHSNSFV